MISKALKSDTNDHAARGRPTLKNVERFRNGSAGKPYERSIDERTSMSEPIQNHVMPNELSRNLHLNKKHLRKRHRIFRRDREPSRIPVRTLERQRTSEQQQQKGARICLRMYLFEYTQVFKNAFL